jgi:spore coat protein U-like protein
MAATTTGNLTVSANVLETCRVTSTGDVTFTDYDPTEDTADNDSGQGFGRFRCTRDTTYWTYIPRTNSMSDGAGNNLTYELYTTDTRDTAFPTAQTGPGTSAANNNVVQLDIYGRIPREQVVPAGSYTENVQFTVEW